MRFVLPSLLLALAPPSVLSLSPQPADDEDEAKAELARAQEEIDKGQFEKAFHRLERIVEKYPSTVTARTAQERTKPNSLMGWSAVLHHGRPQNRVSIVLMQDGCTLDKQDGFDDIAEDVPGIFEHNLVFGEYFEFLNFTKAFVVSVEKGMDGYGRTADTALDARVLDGSVGDHVTCDIDAVVQVMNQMDEVDAYAIVFVPQGLLGTGGDRVATVGSRDPEFVLHDFGHAFATLKDEDSLDNGFRGAAARWINVSNTDDPLEVPWAHWIAADVRGVGVYEGADGRLRGAWKPTASGCRMEQGDAFCPVCREAILLQIYSHVDPIDGARVISDPDAGLEATLAGEETHELEVVVLTAKKHELEVEWYVLPADEAPNGTEDPSVRPRGKRGPLPPVNAKPTAKTRDKRGVHRFNVNPKKLDPGSYRVLCRVRDTTEIRGERYPWVLRDDLDLLESERGWWIEVGE